MKCPKCQTVDLKESKVKDTIIRIDYCKKCKGIWFDRFELERIMENAVYDPPLPKYSYPQDIECPRCGKSLYLCNYPATEIEVDMCKDLCGIWLDKGELKQIQAVRTKLKKAGLLQNSENSSGFWSRAVDILLEGLKI